MKLVLPIGILAAAYVFLGVVVLGNSRKPLSGGVEHGRVHAGSRTDRPPASAAQPPRLFLNGEVARNAKTGRKVVVRSAEWDRTCRCYVYTVTPR